MPNLQQENFTVCENGVVQTENFNVVLPDQVSRPADIVFIVDNSGSMSPFQSAIQNSVTDFVNDLFAEGINAALGLTRFGQSGGGMPIVEENGTLYTDPNVYLSSIFSRNVDNGGTEPGLDAILQSASEFNFRLNSQKIFILLTNEQHNGSSTEASDVLPILEQNNITLFSVINPGYSTSQIDYGDLAMDSGGEQYNIIDLFDPETLQPIIDSIEQGIATDDAYIVSYTSSQPVLDGVERLVEIKVNVGNDSDIVSFTYTPGAAPDITLANNTLSLIDMPQPLGIPLTIQASISDFSAPFVQNATLFYKNTTEASFSTVSMTNINGDLWEAVIPATVANMPGVDFYITATDGVTTTSDRADNPSENPYQIAINPNVAPEIQFTPITLLNAGEDLEVNATITDNTDEVASSFVFYRGIGEPLYKKVAFTNSNGNIYNVIIPSDDLSPQGIQYYLKATDNFGISTYLGEPQNPFEIEILTNQASLTLSPTSINVNINQKVCFIAKLLDHDGTPVANEQILFEVNGANTFSSTVSTNNDGDAEFCYTPLAPGDDKVVVTSGNLQKEATVSVAGSEEINISFFNLMNAGNNNVIQAINDGDVILQSALPTDIISIEAVTNPSQLGSVHFILEGPFRHEQTESKLPYAIFGDNPQGNFNGRLMPPGEYSLIATPYTQSNAQGNSGTPKKINFTIQGEEVPSNLQVTGFELFDAVTDSKVLNLDDGTVINIQLLENDELTILINTLPDFVGSVELELNGPISTSRVENTKPYAIFRNNSVELYGKKLTAGEYTIKATPYTQKNAQGVSGSTYEVHFSIEDVAPSFKVTDFDLYDASTDLKLLDIEDGAIIDLSSLPSNNLTVLINTLPDFVGSVKLELSGPIQNMRVENTEPYAIFRNDNTNLYGKAFVPGQYTLKATPYSEKNAQGTVGTPLETSFTFVDNLTNSARLQHMDKKGKVSNNNYLSPFETNSFVAYPNPFDQHLFLGTSSLTDQISIQLYDMKGKVIPAQIEVSTNSLLEINPLESLPAGLYVLRILDTKKIVKTIKIQKN